MTRNRTPLTALAAVLLALGGIAPASAEPVTALACNDGAVSRTYHYSAAAVEYGEFITTSRCNDINLKLTTNVPGVYLDACVVFVAHTNLCNHDNTYSTFGPQWATVATDVKDGTRFKLRVHAYDTDAQLVNFKLSF